MTAAWTTDELLQPISDEQPTGQNLEDTALLASFDSYRLFGRTKPLDAAPAVASDDGGEPRAVLERDEEPPDWAEIKAKALDALRTSKDLRLLVHFGTAVLRTDGLPAFLETVKVASEWLNSYWDLTYPPVDGDGILRRSALNCFADPNAVIDAVRRAPLVQNAVGRFSLRDIEIAAGQLTVPGAEPLDESQINSAFAAMPIEEIRALQQRVSEGVQALRAIDAKMREEVGTEAAPEFDLLTTQLTRIDKVLRQQQAARPEAAGAEVEAAAGGDGQPAAAASFSGAVRSRQDAIRALEAVSAYFRQHEPSSPVPLFCDRAKRLISMDFLDVLADIAPDAVAQARAAGGLRD